VRCDVKIVRVADGRQIANASGRSVAGVTPQLVRSLAGGLCKPLDDGASVAVVTFRDRSNTRTGRATADELADKLSAAIHDLGTLRVVERIDLRAVMDERDFARSQLEADELLKDRALRKRLEAVEYIVVGGVTTAVRDQADRTAR
jgi:TolB-like protein